MQIFERFHPVLKTYLEGIAFEHHVHRLRDQSKTYNDFIRHFWIWMDGLKVLKSIHYLRDHLYDNIPVTQAALFWLGIEERKHMHASDLLNQLRVLDQLETEKMV